MLLSEEIKFDTLILKVYCQNYSTITKKFNLSVGNERILIGNKIEQICTDNNLDITEEKLIVAKVMSGKICCKVHFT